MTADGNNFPLSHKPFANPYHMTIGNAFFSHTIDENLDLQNVFEACRRNKIATAVYAGPSNQRFTGCVT
jgi:hypothetical protein